MNHHSKILILGNSGELGSELYAMFKAAGFKNLIGSHDDEGRRKVNLKDARETHTFLNLTAPEYIIVATGGYRRMQFDNKSEVMMDNLELDANIMRSAMVHKRHGLKKVYYCIAEKDLNYKNHVIRIVDNLYYFTVTCAKGANGIFSRIVPST